MTRQPSALPRRHSICGKRSEAEYTQKFKHLNLNLNLNPKETQEAHCNSLNNFLLQGFDKHIHWFRCSEKREHLNSAKMQIQAPNTLITSVLQEFQQQYPRFRCSVGRKHRRVQTRPAGTSGKGLTERHHKPPHASEPEPKPQKPLQRTEQLLVAEIHQELHSVQMQRKQEHLNLDKMRI